MILFVGKVKLHEKCSSLPMVFSKLSSNIKQKQTEHFILFVSFVSEKNIVLTRLGAGDFFGEIGILNIDGANRRTADVRSVGYSELFSLSKEDVLEGCRDYPEAERKLYEYAQNRLGCEKSKTQAAEQMKSAFNTLTSIASCLTHPLVSAAAAPPPKNERDSLPKEVPHETMNEQEQSTLPVICRNNRRRKISLPNTNNDNQDKPLLHLALIPEKTSSPIATSDPRSMDLMSHIQLLINERLVS